MSDKEKSELYDFHFRCIHPVIKSHPNTKPLWRRLYWTTPKNSIKYKSGCIDILQEHFPDLFNELSRTYVHKLAQKQEENGCT